MEMSWLHKWLDDPANQVQLLMGTVCVLMWVIAKFLGVASEDFGVYWGRLGGDEDSLDKE